MAKQPLKTQELDGETLYLTFEGKEWLLTIVPAYRSNGTERYDGWFPRHYSNVNRAKASVTRKFGREWLWEFA